MSKSTTPRPVVEAIPALLRMQRRWCQWHLATAPSGKPTKVPDQSTSRLESCRDFATVAQAPQLGFVFTGGVRVERKGKPPVHLVALDLDGCREVSTGKIADWAREVIGMVGNTYTEVSPSGEGLRCFLVVEDLPKDVAATAYVGAESMGSKKPQIQVFGLGASQYVTVTGWHVAGTDPKPKVADLGPLLDLYRMRGKRKATTLPQGTGEAPTVDTVLARMLAEADGDALVNGRWKETHPKHSASEAFQQLERLVLAAAEGHGSLALQVLLEHTAWGRGEVDDSKDPHRYTRASWVEKDLVRTAANTQPRVLVAQTVSHFLDSQDRSPPSGPAPAPTGKRSLLIDSVAFVAQRSEQRWLVEGLLPRTGLAQFFGDPGCGKTPFVMSLAVHIAAGKAKWFDHDIDHHGTVVYMIGEDSNGLGYRFDAELRQFGMTPEDIAGRLQWSTRPGRLTEAADVALWVAEFRKFPEMSVLVVDTQSRNFGSGNENDTQDMTQFVNHLAEVAEALRILVILVHHTGHQNKDRGRGSMVLFGALDASYRVTREGLTVTATANKAKNWAMPEPLVGQLVPVTLSHDSKGRPVTAVTLSTEPPPMDSPFEQIEAELAGDSRLGAVLAVVHEAEGEPLPFATVGERASCTVNEARRCMERLLSAPLGLIEVKSKLPGKPTSYTVTERGLTLLSGDIPDPGRKALPGLETVEDVL
jgi:hypothetical protein